MALEKEPSSFSQKLLWLPVLAYTLVVSLFSFSKASTPIHSKPQEDKPDDDRNRSQNIPSDPIRVIVESLPPKPSPTDKEKRENKIKKRWKIAKGVLEVLALIGLWVYVCETKRTNNLTQQSLQMQRDAARPWVYVPEIIDDIKFDLPERGYGTAEFTLTLRNAGPSPAIVNRPHFIFFRLDKPEVRFWETNNPKPPNLCDIASNDIRFKGPVFPGGVPRSERVEGFVELSPGQTNASTPGSLSGCIVYYGTKGEGPYYTKVVYYIVYNLDGTVRSATLHDINVQ